MMIDLKIGGPIFLTNGKKVYRGDVTHKAIEIKRQELNFAHLGAKIFTTKETARKMRSDSIRIIYIKKAMKALEED